MVVVMVVMVMMVVMMVSHTSVDPCKYRIRIVSYEVGMTDGGTDKIELETRQDEEHRRLAVIQVNALTD
jgi:hypothetical protein